MKLAHLLEKDLEIAVLWESKYQATKNIVLATVETCLETGENHRKIFEIISRHVKEKTITIV